MTTTEKTGLTRRTLLASGMIASAAAMLGAPAIAQGRKKIAMAGINILCFSPMFLARDLGYFTEEGLDVDILETHGGSQTTSALLSGDAKVVSSNYASPVILAAKGMKTKALVGLEMKNIYAFVVRPDLDIPQDDIPALIAGLKGKRLGVASLGSGADTVGSGFLAENGLSDSDVTKVAVGTGGTALAAMAAGGIDAMVTYEPDLTQVLKAGTGKIALDFRSTKSGTDYGRLPATTMQATSQWIDEEPGYASCGLL